MKIIHIKLIPLIFLFFEATPATASASNPFEKAKLSKLPKARSDSITKDILDLVIEGMLPYTFVELPSFRKLMHNLEPRYQVPNRQTFSEQLVPTLHKAEAEKLKNDMKSADAVGITTDGWTSRTTEPYNTITAHYINFEDAKLESKVLQTEKMMGNHTGENLALELDEALTKWELQGKVTAVTVDNAANIGKACTLSRWCDLKIGCFAHTLNLAASKTAQIAQDNFAKWVRPAVKFFHKSHVGAQVLSEMQKNLSLPNHKLILDVKTRWNSSYLMIERFMEQRLAVSASLDDPRLDGQLDARLVKSDLDELQIRKANEYLELMKHFYDATKVVSSENSPCASLILTIQTALEKTFTVAEADSEFVKKLKNTVLNDLQKRYKDPALRNFLEEATALDPRTKNKKCVPKETWARIEDKLIHMLEEGREELDPVTAGTSEMMETEETEVNKAAKKSIFDEDEYDDAEMQVDTSTDRDKAREEIQKYRVMPKSAMESNPILTWKGFAAGMPNLTKLAFR